MEKVAKPKLVFFQFKHDQNLSEFILLHRQQHVKCLSEFFDVVVINEDCNYEQVCDKYEPNITLFEGGVNYKRIHRLNIQNTHTHPKVPKLGLHNGDSWCEARAGFLSDMNEWGIETFFSICVTTAEHAPEIAKNLFVWPNFIDPSIFKDYNESKLIPILLTGKVNPLYPWRQKINKIVSEIYPSLTCPHFGYENSVSKMFYGEQYARVINASWFVPTCGTLAKEILRKHFEISASKACLITEKSPALEAAGFVDMENCVFANEDDILDKLGYLFSNEDKLADIIRLGYELAHSRHTLKNRDQVLQWFKLHRDLKPHQRIVQLSPFEPLIITEMAPATKNSHIASNGLDLALLQQGDRNLWIGEYEKAEDLYLTCHNYITWMPEPKLKLTICNLYKGNAKVALEWIIQPIRYILKEYQASSPDPIEWAYFIITLLCLGDLDEAAKHADQFPSLGHSELDRVRRAISILKNEKDKYISSEDDLLRGQYSIHKLPEQSFYSWLDELCNMLKACNQLHFSKVLSEFIKQEGDLLSNPKVDLENRSIFSGKHWETFRAEDTIPAQKLNYQQKQNSFLSSRFFSQPTHLKWGKWITSKIREGLNHLEVKFGYFLPYRFSEMRNDDLFSTLQKLAREEDIKTALLIGASNGRGSTEALLAGMQENPNKPAVFCVNVSTPQFFKLQKHYAGNSIVRCYQVSPVSSKSFSSEIEDTIKKIQLENNIDCFDVILVNCSDLRVDIKPNGAYRAKFVILEDTSTVRNYKNQCRLLEDPNYVVVTQNPSLRKGYTIFKKLFKTGVTSGIDSFYEV